MTESEESPYYKKPGSTFMSLVLLVGFVLMGLFVGNFLGLVAALPFLDFDFGKFTEFAAAPAQYPDSRIPLLLMQGFAALGAFILAPLLYLKVVDKMPVAALNKNNYLNLIIILITALVVIFSMPVNAVIVEWNKAIRLPSFMAELEEWAMNKEDALQEITLYITDFAGTGEFIFGLIVVAVLPGIGEELLFRGLMQPKISKLTGNIHVGIWVTALIFSFFHFQFYGLIPRMLLGALFGYLYVRSGNIIIPMIAHFVNNGFTLLMIYLNKLKVTDMDLETTESVPANMVAFSVVATVFLLAAFNLYYKSLRKNGLVTNNQLDE